MENKISKIAMWVLFGVTIIVAGLFFLGGNVDDSAEYLEPVFTGELMYLMYIFVLLGTVAAVACFIIHFITKPKEALTILVVLGSVFILLGITYIFASGAPVNVLGLEEVISKGTIKMVESELYTIYILLIIAFVAMIGGNFIKNLKFK